MMFNSAKFECLKSGYNSDLKLDYVYITLDYKHTIEVKENIKDLGVWMSETGEFSYHITKVINESIFFFVIIGILSGQFRLGGNCII